MIRRGSSGMNNLLEQEARSIRADEFNPRERELLVYFTSHVAGAQSLDAVMTSCYQTLAGLGPVDRLELMLMDDDHQRLRLQWVRCKYEPVLLNSAQVLPGEMGAAAKALSQAEPLVINDLAAFCQQDPQDVSSQYLLREGLASRLLWALPGGTGRLLGLLGIGSRTPFAFGYHQVQVAKTIGPRLAQAAEKAFQIEQLTAANRMYLESLGFISHELKNPLASMVMDARLLMQGYLGELTAPQYDRLGKLTRKAEYMFSLIRDFLDLARLETGELLARPKADVNLVEEVVNRSVELASGHFDRYKVELSLELPVQLEPVMCDPELLVIALVNLLGNAAKYGTEGGLARLVLTQQEHSFTIRVWNTGQGFSEEQAQQLFQKFARLDTEQTRKRKGTGVGLYTVRRIARLHGGDVRAQSEPGQYAEFTIIIPQPLICALPG
jgi:signal transduction histidine kinase